MSALAARIGRDRWNREQSAARAAERERWRREEEARREAHQREQEDQQDEELPDEVEDKNHPDRPRHTRKYGQFSEEWYRACNQAYVKALRNWLMSEPTAKLEEHVEWKPAFRA